MLSASPMTIFVLYSLLPICEIVGPALGYRFDLRSYSISIIVLAVFSLNEMACLLLFRMSLNKQQAVFSALLLPMSVINGLVFVYKSDWRATIIFVLVCCGCSAVILVKHAWPFVLKIISAALSVMLILFLLYFSTVDYIFQDLGSSTVVKSIASPQKRFTAEVIDNDQGALGGSTIVNIRENGKDINLSILELTKSPIRIYTGDWGEFESMQISWADEQTIIINDKEYSING